MELNDFNERIFRSSADAPSTKAGKLRRMLESAGAKLRWVVIVMPVGALLMIPILCGMFIDQRILIGGIRLQWFGVWLELLWISLWAGLAIAKVTPYISSTIAGTFTNNYRKWEEMGKRVEVPTALFLWFVGIKLSFVGYWHKFTITTYTGSTAWRRTADSILLSILTGLMLNLLAKILVQIIAIKFHYRTYSERIELNKLAVSSLIKICIYCSQDPTIVPLAESSTSNSSQSTPGTIQINATQSPASSPTTQAYPSYTPFMGVSFGPSKSKLGNRKRAQAQVLEALKTSKSTRDLARRLYRSFALEGKPLGSETVLEWMNMSPAFDSDEEAACAFELFDKEANGNLSLEEFAEACVAVGLERKHINSSLQDLDEVVGKLDKIFESLCFLLTLVGAITLLLTETIGIFASLAGTLVACSWLCAASAQDFFQSVVFVFIKHPYDVGDRIYVYGNAGHSLQGDEFFVKKVSLLYTEFRKLEGLVVQAPNNYINTLFIMNARRSGKVAETIPFRLREGTTAEDIDRFKQRALDYVTAKQPGFKPNLFIEALKLDDTNQVSVNIVIFYKSQVQNERVRMQRRNNILCALMRCAKDEGLEASPVNVVRSG